MSEVKPVSNKTLLAFALILSLGFIISALIVGMTVKQLDSQKSTITVKGLAEKPIKADLAKWNLVLRSKTFWNVNEAYSQLDQDLKQLLSFLKEHGFTEQHIQLGNKSSKAIYQDKRDENGHYSNEFVGYRASQSITISSEDVDKMAATAKDAYLLDEKDLTLDKNQPDYLVSKLEEIKMSLIAAATENAHMRAQEFAKVGQAKVGAMRSANQGTFYILSNNGTTDDSDYGGVYDKSTIDKIVRVVVTVNYGLNGN